MFKTLSTMDDGRKNRGMWAVRTRWRGRASGKAGRSQGEGERTIQKNECYEHGTPAFRTSFFLSLRTRKIFFAFELVPRVLPFSLFLSSPLSKVPSLRIIVVFSLICLIREIVILSETNSRVTCRCRNFQWLFSMRFYYGDKRHILILQECNLRFNIKRLE